MRSKGIYNRYIKRILDFSLSLMGIVILSPLILVTWILIRIKLGSPAIFRQDRPGQHGNIFTLYKFRTMTDQRDAEGNLLPDEVRLTKFGQFVRSTSIDELPELFNILKGDMAIVGPRPLLVEYLPRYNSEQRRRHDVRPGLTGLAQVNGRNSISWQERFEYDVEYVDNVSFYMDLKILLQTVSTVFKREGISSENSVTMEDFDGNE